VNTIRYNKRIQNIKETIELLKEDDITITRVIMSDAGFNEDELQKLGFEPYVQPEAAQAQAQSPPQTKKTQAQQPNLDILGKILFKSQEAEHAPIVVQQPPASASTQKKRLVFTDYQKQKITNNRKKEKEFTDLLQTQITPNIAIDIIKKINDVLSKKKEFIISEQQFREAGFTDAELQTLGFEPSVQPVVPPTSKIRPAVAPKPTRTSPSGVPPSGVPPSGVPPSGVPPSGVPPPPPPSGVPPPPPPPVVPPPPPPSGVPPQKINVDNGLYIIPPPPIPLGQSRQQLVLDNCCVQNTVSNLMGVQQFLYNPFNQINPLNQMFNYPLHLSSSTDLDDISPRFSKRRNKLKELYTEYRKLKHKVIYESDPKYNEYKKRKHQLKKEIKKLEE
jgi:hypothetical protein